MTTHPECNAFQQNGSRIFTKIFRERLHSVVHLEHIVTIDLNTFDPVANGFVDKALAAELLVTRRRQTIAVVFDHKNYGKIPYGGNINCFMKISLTCSTITIK